jgi:hypothetical protein
MNKKANKNEIIRAYIDGIDNDIDSLSARFKIPRSNVSLIIDNYFSNLKRLFVVSSLDLENTYYAFNGINERKFTTDFLGYIQERYLFNSYEREFLKKLGFNI